MPERRTCPLPPWSQHTEHTFPGRPPAQPPCRFLPFFPQPFLSRAAVVSARPQQQKDNKGDSQ
ncbi:hypothetical protein E2C01_028497 [Portunus trituberculatus]|uniref:Uncharacterized protein n=1 Tax=Portunus trituberculatus TaxID=210409 RepID=A0A5B7EQ59_PORTR|nr:hypothetical protein [Portunus trituberculatus]